MGNMRINLNPIEDITDFPPTTAFDQIVKEAKEKYDAFLAECFEMCQISTDYIIAHPEEFSKRENTQGDFCQYFRNGEEIFTITRHREYEDMSQCVFKYIATFPKHTE